MANEIIVEISAKVDKIQKALDDLTKKAEKSGEAVGENLADGMKSGIGALREFRSAGEGGIDSVIGLLRKFGPAALAAAAAVFAIKEAIDLAFEGEKIKAIENQFNLLSERAGVSGEALKASFETAAAGMVDTTDIMVSANKAL